MTKLGLEANVPYRREPRSTSNHPRSTSLAQVRVVDSGGQPLRRRPPSSRRVLRSLLRSLGRVPLCALATVDPTGRAHGSHVYFAFSTDLRLYFLSDPRSRHARHLVRNGSMAVSVYDSSQSWGGPDCGVALYGTAREVPTVDQPVAERLYGNRFPGFRRWQKSLRRGAAASGWRFYRFTPRSVKVFDERSLGSGVFVTAAVRRRSSGRRLARRGLTAVRHRPRRRGS